MIDRKRTLWHCDDCGRWINHIVNGYTCPFCGVRACRGVLA